MNLFYKPKHLKKSFNIKPALTFIYEEITWYGRWWRDFIVFIFQKLYKFGECVLEYGTKLIDYIDGVGN